MCREPEFAALSQTQAFWVYKVRLFSAHTCLCACLPRLVIGSQELISFDHGWLLMSDFTDFDELSAQQRAQVESLCVEFEAIVKQTHSEVNSEEMGQCLQEFRRNCSSMLFVAY